MTFVNNNKLQYDMPFWQPQAPLVGNTAAGTATCTADDGSDPALYYNIGTAFYKWCSRTNGSQQLASLPTAPATSIALKYNKYAGHRGNCLGATINTIKLAPVNPSLLVGKTIRITDGAGAGQDRTITSTNVLNIHDKGLLTSVSSLGIGDTTKNWKINEWVGYQVRILYGTGQTILRKVLYNDATTLYFQDNNYQQLESWQNTPLYTATPYTLPVVTAGSQGHYSIESCSVTVNTNWDVQPNSTSSFAILTGGIFAVTASSTAPWATVYYYDVLSNIWTYKTSLGGLLPSALAGDFSIERLGETGGAFLTGTTTSATSTSLTVATSTPSITAVDRYANYQVRITGGTGIGQRRRILTNTTSVINVANPWTVTPDSTSTFSIYGNTDIIYLSGNNQSSLYQLNIEKDFWTPSHAHTIGICRNGSATFGGQEGLGLTSIARNTNGVTNINTTPVAGGSNYTVGDILTLSTGGSAGKVKVLSVSTTGAVTSVMLYACGSGYSVTTSSTTGGTGTLCTIGITSVGVVGRATTALNHNLAIGDSITLSGATESAWNNSFTVLGCDTLTNFDIATTATSVWVATASQSTTVIVDSAQNWTNGEHVGRLVVLQIAGPSPTTQVRRIVSNTATTLTVATITAGVNGTSRYAICEPQLLGRAVQFPADGKGGVGYATGGSTTTLVDSTKSWTPNQWAGAKFRILNGTGINNEISITSNTETTLTYATQTFTPDATTKYLVMDTFGLATAGTTTTLTDTTKKWIVNQWAGKKLKIIAGTGQSQELIITSNTATALTFATATAPDTTSYYCILESQSRGVGSTISWVFGNTDSTNLTQGKYLACFFGNATNVFGRYDISTELWDITQITSPQGELLTTGSSYAYSGKDRIYYSVNSTGRTGYINVNTLQNYVYAQVWQLPLGTAIAGNRIEVITTADGVDLLILADNTGSRLWKSMVLFYTD